jgi:hypothetical protein
MYTREATIDLRIVRAAGDSGEEPQRSLRCHLAFMSASAGYPRFFKAFHEQIMDFVPLVESDLPQRLKQRLARERHQGA